MTNLWEHRVVSEVRLVHHFLVVGRLVLPHASPVLRSAVVHLHPEHSRALLSGRQPHFFDLLRRVFRTDPSHVCFSGAIELWQLEGLRF